MNDLDRQCYEMKLKALEMARATSFGAHIGGGFSAMEIMASLYQVANIPSMYNPARDRIIVSKGHCVLAYYTALWKKGFISVEDLDSFETDGTHFYGHPYKNPEKGIEFSGGSLGLGMSFAVGVAKACKMKGFDNKVFVLVGDGELNEGIVWEALMATVHFKLDNVTVIVDNNGYQLDGPTDEIMALGSIESKFAAFGFDVDVVDGHSTDGLMASLRKSGKAPRAIIANTVKANGISFLVNNKLAHQCVLSKKKYGLAVEDINKYYGHE